MQVDPIKFGLKAPGSERLKLKYDELLSNVAFKTNLRRYSLARAALTALAALAGGRGWEAILRAADADPAAAAAQLGLPAPPQPRGAPGAAARTNLFVGDVAAATSAVVEVAPHCVDGAYAQVLRVHALERTAEVRRCRLNPVKPRPARVEGCCFSA